MKSDENPILAGARLMLRGWGALMCAYAVSLLLGIVAGLPLTAAISGLLDHSFESQRLVTGFDFGTLIGLLMRPEFTLNNYVSGAFFVAFLNFLFMLFFTGGLIADYCSESRLTAGPFFAACGGFFWRFVRLWLFLLLMLVPVGIVFALLARWTSQIAANAPGDRLGYLFFFGCMAFALILFLVLRLWLDVAQIHAVAENERRVRRALGKSFRQTFGNFGSLVGILLVVGVVAILGTLAALSIYVKVIRAEQIGLSILLGQFVVFFWLTMRLWLRACETAWYQHCFPPPVVFAEAPIAPAPLEPEPVPATPITEPPPEPIPPEPVPPVAPPDETPPTQ